MNIIELEASIDRLIVAGIDVQRDFWELHAIEEDDPRAIEYWGVYYNIDEVKDRVAWLVSEYLTT